MEIVKAQKISQIWADFKLSFYIFSISLSYGFIEGIEPLIRSFKSILIQIFQFLKQLNKIIKYLKI